MKRSINLLTMLLFIVVLAGCSGTVINLEKESEKEEVKEIYTGKLDIGETFYEENNNYYIYSGILNESVVITTHYAKSSNTSVSIPLYIPLERKEGVELPYTNAKLIIKNINKKDGTIDVQLET